MNTLKVTIRERVAWLMLDRGKANALNAEMVGELRLLIDSIAKDDNILGLVITGKEGFFSAGLDLVELYNYDEEQIKNFWTDFLDLVRALASFKKPFVAAINGHSPAGGCVLALCADYRIMAEGRYVIGLNEIPVGIVVPETIFQLYAFWIGEAKAYRYLLEGKLMNAEEALNVGLVDQLVSGQSLMRKADEQIQKYIRFQAATWQQSKLNMRHRLLQAFDEDHTQTLSVLLRQWWLPSTRSILKTVIQNLQQKSSA